MAKRSRASSSAGTVTGVDIDGPTATTAVVSDGVVVTTRLHVADTGIAALTDALTSINSSDPVIVSISSASNKSTLTTLPAVSDPAANRLLEARGALSIARVPAGAYTTLYGVPTEFVDAAYDALAPFPRAVVTAQPATLPTSPGLVLRVGHRVVDLSLTPADGPTLYEVLPVRGLYSFVDDLGGVGARERVHAALAGTPTDAIAAAESTRWLSGIAESVKAAVTGWEADGFSVPTKVYVVGTTPDSSLSPHLVELGFTTSNRVEVPAISALPEKERLAALPAARAALSYPLSSGSELRSTDQVAQAARAVVKARSARKRRTFILAALALVLPSALTLAGGYAYTSANTSPLDPSAARAAASSQAYAEVSAPYSFTQDVLVTLLESSTLSPIGVTWDGAGPVRVTFPGSSTIVEPALTSALPEANVQVDSFTASTVTFSIGEAQ